MTPMRPAAEWVRKYFDDDLYLDQLVELSMADAYRAGQEAMREAAGQIVGAGTAHFIARAIRALPIEEPKT